MAGPVDEATPVVIKTAIIRTVVPFLLGWFVALAAKAGLDIDSATAEASITFLVGTLYYVAVMLLQKYVSPSFGWLLGSPTVPEYVKPVAPAEDAKPAVEDASPAPETDTRTPEQLAERAEFEEDDDTELFEGQAPLEGEDG